MYIVHIQYLNISNIQDIISISKKSINTLITHKNT